MMRKRMQELADEMLDGRILLREAMEEFERVFIEQALSRNRNHICNTASALGMHRNTVAKKVASYSRSARPAPRGKSVPKKARPR